MYPVINCKKPKIKYIVDIKLRGKIINWIIIQSIKVIPNIIPRYIPNFLFFRSKTKLKIFVIPFTISKAIPEKIKF